MEPRTLNDFYPQLGTQDTRKKLHLATDIIKYLEDQKNPLESEDLSAFIDGVVSWLGSSNYKICSYGLEILGFFVDRMEDDFKPYISVVFPATIDRLGDNKDQVREQAQLLIQKLMHPVSTPQYIFDKLVIAFTHKSWRVREEVMHCLQQTLERHGANSLSLSKYVPHIVRLLGDPTSQVRDAALNTLVEIYRHVGERVRSDLQQRKYNIPQNRLQSIMAKFDEVKEAGTFKPTASLMNTPTVVIHSEASEDEVDRSLGTGSKSASFKRASSAPPVRRAVFSAPKLHASSAQAGAVDEETFIRSFEDVPKVQLFSAKDLEDGLQKCRDILNDPGNDWEKRVDSLKKVRAYLKAGAAEYDELSVQLRQLESAFQSSVKDLRSQVVREACISIAFLSQQLGHKMDHFAEVVLSSLINLIPNSAKVMSTAGIVAIRFIIRYTHGSRLIPIITTNMNSKSKDIRRACCEFLDQLLHTWPTHTIERHIANIQDAIKKGLGDADPDARVFSRRAFWGFAEHFSEQAESLLNSLDSGKQKMLQGQMSLSNSSSNNSLNNSIKMSRSRASSACGSTENLSRIPSFSAKKSGIPMLTSPRNDPDSSRISNGSLAHTTLRSNSAIDLNAVQRARARATYAAAARLRVGSGASLPRARKISSTEHTTMTTSAITSPERSGRSRSKVGVSQSQPSSRSGSPSSRLSYATYSPHVSDSGRTRRRGGVAHSTGTSRETSPTRTLYGTHERRLSGSGPSKKARPGPDRVLLSQSGKGLLTQKILTQNKETEAAVADALKGSPRKRYDAFGNESDDSETSSVCSERSYGSYGRPIDSYFWHGSIHHPLREHWNPAGKDVMEIINNLASQHWADRKEGLVGLQALVNSHRTLTGGELKRVTDIFTKMFMDPHTKIFSIFLDTLHDLIMTHKSDLDDWLYVLMTRLFNKLGADLLGSVQTKIQRTLDIIRDSFALDQQFNVIMRFLTDHTQTPNVKVKLAVLNYINALWEVMNPSDFVVNSESQAAISKIILWASDPKSAEIRKASQSAILALFSLNSPEFTRLLSQLPKTYQENTTRILHNHIRRNTSTDSSPLKVSPIPMATKAHSPNLTLSRSRPPKSLDYDDTENLNPEEILNSLRKTTTEIQNYSFDAVDHGLIKETKGFLDKDRDTTSQDSGISQMSAADGRTDMLEESPDNGSPTRKKDYNSYLYQDKTNRNGFDKQHFFDSDSDLLSSDLKQDKPAIFLNILTELTNQNRRYEERKIALTHLTKLAREGCSTMWDEYFRSVLRVLLETLGDSDASLRALALRALCELLKWQSVRFQGFAELTILKILKANRDSAKDVVRAAEVCAATLAATLPAEQCIRILKPIIETGDYPDNQAAIKMLTKVIEQQSKVVVMQHISEIMPGLIQAYDNPESSVRKAAVFCMVAAHIAVGEALKPYLSELNGSKMKLLNLYIKRAQSQNSQAQSSSPTSPLHSSGSSQAASPRT